MLDYTVLVVDDEVAIANAVTYALKREGYKVITAYGGQEALDCIANNKPRIIIMDVMMPMVSGFDVLKRMHQSPEISVILLTAKDDVVDKVIGLELGADDYMTKPFDMRELLARVNVIKRRIGDAPISEKEVLEPIEGLTVNHQSREVRLDGQLIEFTPKEYDLLYKLMTHEGQVFTREQLIESLWDYDFEGDTRTVDLHIQRIRKKMGRLNVVIQTVHGVGYKWTRGL